jgi:hypothetical protein
MRRKEMKSRKKMHKNKRIIKRVQFIRKKESVFENYVPEVSTFEMIIKPKRENKRNRKEVVKYGEKE